MTKQDFLKNLKFPLPNAILKKYPSGNIMQYWGENPQFYSQAFGQKDDLHKYLAGHSGIDIATKFRDPIYAAHDGTILGINDDPKAQSGGRLIYLHSDNLDDNETTVKIYSAYAHLDELTVDLGQTVKQGDLIGYEGNTGFVVAGSTPYWGNAPAGIGVHLHFGLHEERLDPVSENWIPKDGPLGDTFDPLPWFTDDWSGTEVLLYNMSSLLRYWSTKFFGK